MQEQLEPVSLPKQVAVNVKLTDLQNRHGETSLTLDDLCFKRAKPKQRP